MKDSQDLVIYVGKAKNLRNRVSSYFRNNKGHSPKIKKLVQHLKDFDYILTDTEFEAFMLECHMIKELKPIYNRVMKNPQAFCYIQILLNQGHQDIKITYHPIEKDGNLYFGPFTNRSSVEKAILGIKEGYKILCGHRYKKGQPCLNYSLGLCRGICLGGPVEKEYQQILDKIIALLNGTDMILIDEMKKMMLEASEQFDFEAAAKYRDYIEAVHSLLNKEKVIAFTEEDHQILIIEPLNEDIFKFFLIKRTEVLFSERINLKSTNEEQLIEKMKTEIFTYFTRGKHPFLQVGRDEIVHAQIIYSYLKGENSKKVIIPEDWLDVQNHNRLDEAIYHLLKGLKQKV